MKRVHWKLVMFFALLLMFLGAGISIWGIESQSNKVALTGLVTIMVVCFSWWFWVMFVIRSIINNTENTCSRLTEIKDSLGEVKSLLKDNNNAK